MSLVLFTLIDDGYFPLDLYCYMLVILCHNPVTLSNVITIQSLNLWNLMIDTEIYVSFLPKTQQYS